MLDFRRPLSKFRKTSNKEHCRSKFVTERHGAWGLGIPESIECPPEMEMPAILAVGGGKGGVGKSIISSNLAAVLSRFGLRVLVVDLDLGCANLHTHFGVPMPRRTLADFILHKTHSFRDIILPAPVQGVAFVAGGRENEWGQIFSSGDNYFFSLWEGIFASKREFNVDVVVFDLGAGTHQHTMRFFSAAHLGIVTVLPEPTSIENAYVFIKLALWNLIENLGERLNQQLAAQEIKRILIEDRGGRGHTGYVEPLRQLRSTYPEFIRQLVHGMHGRIVGLVVNQARDQSDVEVGRSMEHIIQRYFGMQCKAIGHLNYDESVWKSLRNRRLLVADFPHCQIAKNLSNMASSVLKLLGIKGG